MDTYCGYIALLGRPNAGKSTLLNACIGQKIVGVSKKPQTTRNKIIGIDTQDQVQYIYLDTPGIHNHSGKPQINRSMNQLAWSAVSDADIICYLIDTKHGWTPEDMHYISSLIEKGAEKVFVFASKIDCITKEQVKEGISSIQTGLQTLKDTLSEQDKKKILNDIPKSVSAKRVDYVKEFKSLLASHLPLGPMLYDADELTDKSERFVVSEIIREQAFRQLGQELPYGTSVTVSKLTQNDKLTSIHATIITNKKSHKPIIIGRKGQLIKAIGSSARENLERHFNQKVYLELFVKVQENWIDNEKLIEKFQEIEAIN